MKNAIFECFENIVGNCIFAQFPTMFLIAISYRSFCVGNNMVIRNLCSNFDNLVFLSRPVKKGIFNNLSKY